MSEFCESALAVLRQVVEKQFHGDLNTAAAFLGVSYQTLYTWIKGKRRPRLSCLSPVLDKLGAKLILPGHDAGREVYFVNANPAPTAIGQEPPRAEDYIAIPMFGEVGAGNGYYPQDEICGWFMVNVNLPAVRHRRNLIAVEIGKNSTSMRPTLNPGDIVLVDRDDRDVSSPGRMMLVLDPMDSSGMVKRVSVQKDRDDFRITFYSGNAAQWPPSVYSFNKDFDHEWDKVIVGRVIWAWSDMREK